jgi:hypothetical protein
VSILVKGRGINKLSQLQIDCDKDWRGRGIINIRHIAAGMEKGHIIQHNGQVLETLSPEAAENVLTSAGPGQKVVWAPGGTYLHRYFPVTLDLDTQMERHFNAEQIRELMAPLTVPYGIEHRINPSWFARLEPATAISRRAEIFQPQRRSDKTPSISGTAIQAELPVQGAIAEDGGTRTDETDLAKSAILIDQQYAAGDDSQQGFSNSSYWEAQTFTTALAQRARGVWLKVYRESASTAPGLVTVSLKEVDAAQHPTGVDLCIAVINGNETPFLGSGQANWLWVPFTTAPWLAPATRYALVVRCGSSGLYWRSDNSSPTYGGGNREYSSNAGTSWTADNGKDYMFKVSCTLDHMNLLPAVLKIGDSYYWGYDWPFERLLQDVSVVASGDYSLAWEYSRGEGAWAACIDLEDNTSRFQNYGLNAIAHTPQADWDKDWIQDRYLYWLRMRCTHPGTDYLSPRAGYARISKDYY